MFGTVNAVQDAAYLSLLSQQINTLQMFKDKLLANELSKLTDVLLVSNEIIRIKKLIVAVEVGVANVTEGDIGDAHAELEYYNRRYDVCYN